MTSLPVNNVASTARAFATYSLIPYLGILFCPGAVLVGGFGIFRSRPGSANNDSSQNVCYLSAFVGLVLLAIQLLLWWILYKVPIWAKGL
jgi:hypothetical protein